jgi:hypothetical protein
MIGEKALHEAVGNGGLRHGTGCGRPEESIQGIVFGYR